MSNRPSRDWGSIPDWITVLLVVFIPLFTALLGSSLGGQSRWTDIAIPALAVATSFGIVLILGSIRSKLFKTFFSALAVRILAASRQGALIRFSLGVGVGATVFFLLYLVGGQTENGWIAIGTVVATWLGLSVASSNAMLRQLRTEYSTLWDIARRITDLETRVLSYPDGDFDRFWRYEFAAYLDVPTEVLEMSGPDTHVEDASCMGIARQAIFQHPPLDGQTDAILRFSGQPPGGAGYMALTFYTGIRDSHTLADGTIERCDFEPNKGNRIRFQIFVNGHLVFQEIRDSFEWRFHALVLPPPAKQLYEIEFRTNALGQPHGNWAVWGEPRLADWVIVFEDLARLRELIEKHE
jgi:hypothetical protein